jgi:hypothetical protein
MKTILIENLTAKQARALLIAALMELEKLQDELVEIEEYEMKANKVLEMNLEESKSKSERMILMLGKQSAEKMLKEVPQKKQTIVEKQELLQPSIMQLSRMLKTDHMTEEAAIKLNELQGKFESVVTGELKGEEFLEVLSRVRKNAMDFCCDYPEYHSHFNELADKLRPLMQEKIKDFESKRKNPLEELMNLFKEK